MSIPNAKMKNNLKHKSYVQYRPDMNATICVKTCCIALSTVRFALKKDLKKHYFVLSAIAISGNPNVLLAARLIVATFVFSFVVIHFFSIAEKRRCTDVVTACLRYRHMEILKRPPFLKELVQYAYLLDIFRTTVRLENNFAILPKMPY